MGVICKAINQEDFSQFYITAVPREGSTVHESVAKTYSEIGDILKAHGVAILQEKIYGLTRLKSEIVIRRSAALVASGCDPDTPHTYIDGAPVMGNGFAGVQIWGISHSQSAKHSVSSVAFSSNHHGRLWKSDQFTILYVPHIKESCPEEGSAQDNALKAKRMFHSMDSQLTELGFDFRHVIRTWIYLPKLLDWYLEFNNVRSEFFQAKGIGDHVSGSFLPASTCIQARCDDEECIMDLIAVRLEDGSKVAVSPVRRTSRQDDALAYGSSFSRAVCLDLIGNRVIYCSGTASIDREGATVGVNDPARQCAETLDNIEALLSEYGGALNDVVSATLFCKNESVEVAWKHLAGRRLPADFPTIIVRADICREELLVELEMTAAVPHAKSRFMSSQAVQAFRTLH